MAPLLITSPHGQPEATTATLAAARAIVLATPGASIRRSGIESSTLPDERFQWGAVVLRALRG